MKKVIAGFIVGLLLATSVSVFAETNQTINAIFDRVKLIINGQQSSATTLLYNGSTYIQLRPVADAFGANLAWDPTSNTATLTTVQSPTPASLPVATPAPIPTAAPTPKPAPVPTPAATSTMPPMPTSRGTIDNVAIEIMDARQALDFRGNPCIVVTFSFTNNGSQPASFFLSTFVEAYQNLVQLDTTIMTDKTYGSDETTKVKPGGTLVVQEAFSTDDFKSPLEVYVRGFLSSDKTELYKIFRSF